ncbi:MAG: PKD domain-containing protein [archaeon]
MTNMERLLIGMRKAALVLAMLLFTMMIMNIASASIDLVSPANSSQLNQRPVVFDYYAGMENASSCTLKIDSSTADESTNITSLGFNQMSANLSQGEHEWMISCTDGLNVDDSETRRLLFDGSAPTVVLFSPQDNAAINLSSVEFSFVAVDNIAENIACELIIDGSINASMNVTNSVPTSKIVGSLSDGLHQWQVRCNDSASNSMTSESISFTINTTRPEPVFGLVLPRTEFYAGEQGTMMLVFPTGSNARVETCPDKPGFVECNITLNSQNLSGSPMEKALPYYLTEGRYIVEAYFNYSGYSATKVERYNVTSSISIGIKDVDRPRKNEVIILDADASGGIAPLIYSWRLSNGSVIEDDKVNITYALPGNYTNTVTVKDAFNNSRNKSITLLVSNSFSAKVYIRDAETNAAISKATVELDDLVKTTDTTGLAEFAVREGKRDVLVLRENYSGYNGELNITKDESFTIALQPTNFTATNPRVSLISPTNNSGIPMTEIEVAFSVEHRDRVNCTVYINEQNDGFYINLGSMDVNANDYSEQRFMIFELENKSYWWKVECIDSKGRSGKSETRRILVGSEAIKAFQTADQGQGDDITQRFTKRVKEYEQIINDFNSLPNNVREAAMMFGIRTGLESAISKMKNAIRDIDGLQFNSALTPEQLAAEKKSLSDDAEIAYQKAPISIELTGEETFVDYIQSEELETLINEYFAAKGNNNSGFSMNKVLEFTNDLQQEVVISSKVKGFSVTLKDGTSQEFTGIIREVKTYNITKGAFLLEIIPKSVATDASEIMSEQRFEVIKNDPIIKVPLSGDLTWAYYFAKKIPLENLRDAKTAVFMDPDAMPADRITGFSITKIKLPNLKFAFISVIIILLGGLIFVGIKYDGLNAAKYALYRMQKKQSLHYINVILSDIEDNLQMGYLEKAFELYEEAKNTYSFLPTMAKNDIYPRVVDISGKMELYYNKTNSDMKDDDRRKSLNDIKSRILTIQGLLNSGRIMPALEEYKIIEHDYNSLDDQTKALFHPALVDLGNKIQIVIDSNKG